MSLACLKSSETTFCLPDKLFPMACKSLHYLVDDYLPRVVYCDHIEDICLQLLKTMPSFLLPKCFPQLTTCTKNFTHVFHLYT